MNNFWVGFEKRAALSAEQRSALEDEMHQRNQQSATFGQRVAGSAKAMGLLGAAGGLARGAVMGGPGFRGIGALAGAAHGGLSGAVAGAGIGAGAHLFWKHRGKGYLKNVSDENLIRGVESYRRHAAGHKNALNEAHPNG